MTLDFILFVRKRLLSDYGTRVRLYRIVARAVSGNYCENFFILESEGLGDPAAKGVFKMGSNAAGMVAVRSLN